jgi:hypothetical protein
MQVDAGEKDWKKKNFGIKYSFQSSLKKLKRKRDRRVFHYEKFNSE